MSSLNNNAGNNRSFADASAFEIATEKLQKLNKLSVADKIRYCNARALPESMTEYPLVTEYEGVRVAPSGCSMSVIEGFTPLIDRQSGAGLTTLSAFKIKFLKTEKIKLTVSIPRLTEAEIQGAKTPEEALKHKALATLVAKWNPNNGAGLCDYAKGQPTVMPSGSTPIHWKNSRGHLIPSGKLEKSNFTFIFEKMIGNPLALVIGKDPKTATRVEIELRFKGVWVGKSEAEKFCATMTKLCLDPFVIPEKLTDLIYGGIALFDGNASLDAILKGEEPMLPWAMAYSGQETLKGASSAEEAAQFVKDNTGKSVLRESSKVEGYEGLLTHDCDEFVEFRNSFVIAASAQVWIARWIDSSLLQVYQNNKSLKFFPLEDGVLAFHRTTVRIVNKPLTLETSTQLENCNSKGTGRKFLGLQSVVENQSPAFAAIAAVLHCTAFEDKVNIDMLTHIATKGVGLTIPEGMLKYASGHKHIGNEVKILNPKPGMIIPLECDPLVTFKNVAKIWGNTFVVKWNDQAVLVSPKVAKGLGYAPGGNLELYAKVFYDLCTLLTIEDESHFEAEMAQWWAAYMTTLSNLIKGGDTQKMQAKCGLIKKGTRAKGVYSAKVGTIVGKGITPGYMYVSEDSPFATMRGQSQIWWRNPMPFIGLVKIAVVGTNPATCDVLIPKSLKGKGLANNKVYFHPYDVSRTFGDIDGDGIQFECLEELIEWAIKNEVVIKKNPGLWETLIQLGLIVE